MFDRVYVIHLPNAEWGASIDRQLESMGWRVTFVHADPLPKGFQMTNMRRNPGAEFGVNLSHIKAVVQAIADWATCPMFLEDDVVFSENATERLAEAVKDLPPDWDILYLGGHPRGPATRVSDKLVKVNQFSFAEAYAINGSTALRQLFDTWCDRIGKPNAMYDFILSDFASRMHAYCAYPLITSQPPGHSIVRGEPDDKRGLIQKGWANNLK